MTNETDPVVDASHVGDLVSLDQGKGVVFARFVDAFVTRMPQRLAELNAYANSGDLANLSEAAHSLRGASGNLGAFRLAVLLGRIEAAGKTGDATAARASLASVDAEYEAARAALLDAVRGVRASAGPADGA